MSRFQLRRGSPCPTLIACGSGTLAVAATLLAGCGSGGGGGTKASATPTPTPTPSASATPTPTPTPGSSPTPTPTPVTTPTPSPTPTGNAFSLIFSAPPAGDDPANENPNPSQSVTLASTSPIGNVSGNAGGLLSFEADHGSGGNGGDYSLQFLLYQSTGGFQAGHVYTFDGLDQITYKETESDGSVREWAVVGTEINAGSFTVVSVNNGVVHLKGSVVMMGSGSVTGVGYFTLAFDVSINLAGS